jgi:predicted Rossmann fold flavoprotein
MRNFDVLIIGAGGAGMMCALEAGKRGRRVALMDHSAKVGAKILISGGGRCNFTNLGAGPDNYVSQNPHFCKSALARYTPADFIALVEKHHIPYHEKKLGQLFCDRSAQDIVDLLTGECSQAGVEFFMGREILSVSKKDGFEVTTEGETFQGASLVVATGGLSIPKVGATGFGHQLARQFGLKLVPTSPALDGFRFSPSDLKKFGDLTGVAVDSRLEAGGVSFRENILFTHAGLSGPAALQASLYWEPGQPIEINFIPDQKPEQWLDWFEDLRDGGSQEEVRLLLRRYLPNRLAERLTELELPAGATPASLKGSTLAEFCKKLQAYQLTPQATVGYLKAEVTRGGVDTDELSSKTMESRKVPGLFFIGEVVDVTGWLGGYNFQWAWSSGWAAGQEA